MPSNSNENTSKNILFVDSFILKVVAILTMTIDHIGYQLTSYMYTYGTAYQVGSAFRYIGRIAMPLFAFMIAEGAYYSKNKKKYALRLGVLAFIISLALLVMFILTITGKYDLKSIYSEGNIFIDLLLGLFVCLCLGSKKIWIKLLSIIPIAISILSYIAKAFEVGDGYTIYWYPAFLRGQYDWLCTLLVGLFYLARPATNLFFDIQGQKVGLDHNSFTGTRQYQFANNIFSFAVLLLMTSFYYGLSFAIPSRYITWNVNLQTVMIAAGAFILLYNGKRGYNSKWFQYGAYIYYPLHMVIIAVIFYLIFGY